LKRRRPVEERRFDELFRDFSDPFFALYMAAKSTFDQGARRSTELEEETRQRAQPLRGRRDLSESTRSSLRRFNMSQHKGDVPKNPKDMSGPQVISHDDEKG
jgi:hypothetical protein